MAQATEPTPLNNLANPDTWSRLLADISEWANETLLTQATLIEIALIVLAAVVAWPVAKKFRDRFDYLQKRDSRYALMQRLWRELWQQTFPIVWLFGLLFTIVVSQEMEQRIATQVIAVSLLSAWIIVGLATIFVANAFWSRIIAFTAWLIAALNILGLLEGTIELLDSAGINLGDNNRISALIVIQTLIAMGILLWITAIIGHLVEGKLRSSPNLTPSMKVLSIKLLWIILGALAFLTALAVVGVDLTALAVFGGAIGVGLGFGLQKIFANLVSGFILLLDKSIKPGDTIAIEGYFGRVDSLGARYVSVTTRDGIEYLIPNEELITSRVENWSHSHHLLRLHQTIGVHYDSDIHKVIDLCLEAAHETPRILEDPKTTCLLREYDDSSVNFELRFWINDPMNGRANVTSDLLIRIWDKFKEHGVEIPYPQRDLHLRSSDIGELPPARRRAASADDDRPPWEQEQPPVEAGDADEDDKGAGSSPAKRDD